MRIATLGLLLLLLACGPRPEPAPDAADLQPQEVARAFARAVLEQADPAEAMRWADATAALDVRSQVGFLQGERVAKYDVGRAARGQDGVWTAAVTISDLKMGAARYRGQMHLDMGRDGRRVRDSALLLEREDGVGFSL